MTKKIKTGNAVEILTREFGPVDESFDREERQRVAIGLAIYDARKRKGLLQRELAELVGTAPSAISRLESADYEGHSLPMLRKIAAALGCRVEVRLTPESDNDLKAQDPPVEMKSRVDSAPAHV